MWRTDRFEETLTVLKGKRKVTFDDGTYFCYNGVMVTETREKKRGRHSFRKRYAYLLRERKKVEEALQMIAVKQKGAFSAGRGALLDLANLHLKGGPRNLSGRLRNYLHNL